MPPFFAGQDEIATLQYTYEAWASPLLNPEDEVLIVPCAGTAPAALAAERVYGSEKVDYVCIDVEEDAYRAFSKRRENEVLAADTQPEANL